MLFTLGNPQYTLCAALLLVLYCSSHAAVAHTTHEAEQPARQLFCVLTETCASCRRDELATNFCSPTKHREALRCTPGHPAHTEHEVVLTVPLPADASITQRSHRHNGTSTDLVLRSCKPPATSSSSSISSSSSSSSSSSGGLLLTSSAKQQAAASSGATPDRAQVLALPAPVSSEEVKRSAQESGLGARHGGGRQGIATHMSMFSFELAMLAVLGVSLPIVYWRKIRIRHL